MQCNLFPIENNMCIESQQVTSGPSSSIRGNKQQTNKNDQSNNRTENEQFQRQLMNSICNSDWGKFLFDCRFRSHSVKYPFSNQNWPESNP